MSSSASRPSKRQGSSVSESVNSGGAESDASAKVKSSKGCKSTRGNTKLQSEEVDMVTIQVPRGFADQASFNTMNKLRSEVSTLRAKQEENEEVIGAMQNEIRTLKDSLAENTAAIEKYKEKSKKKLAKYEAKISQALEEIKQLREQKEQPRSSKSYRRILISELAQLPTYDGSRVGEGRLEPISFMTVDECFSMGWEREFGERFDEARQSVKSKKFLYFPKLIFMVHAQHGFAIGPKAQVSQEHNFEVSSPFNGLLDDERELFFDLAKRRGEPSSEDIFYAGTYKCVRLDHLQPEGISYSDDIYNEFGLLINRVTAMVVEAQIQRPRLRRDEIADLVKSGVIKLEFIGLQCVGFNSELYRRITGSAPASVAQGTVQVGTKRPRGPGSASFPNDKRSKLK